MKELCCLIGKNVCSLFNVAKRYNIAVLQILNPYVSMIIAVLLYKAGGNMICTIFVPIAFFSLVYICRCMESIKYSREHLIPIARKRFVTGNEDGSYTISKEELPEMIEYMAELEKRLDEMNCYKKEV